jgi:signal transduction histidine kinase
VQARTKALKQAIENLKKSQKQIIAQEKLASLGTLVAGIAHEIKNPLNFVINFADISRDYLKELQTQKLPVSPPLQEKIFANKQDMIDDLSLNMDKIIEYAKRADHILKSMLLHAREGEATPEPTNINMLLDEYTELCYQSFLAQHPQSIPLVLEKQWDENLHTHLLYPQDIGRAFLNLLNNALQAVTERFLKEPGYKPKIIVQTKNLENDIWIGVEDNGPGIPSPILSKIFDPFFSTKSPGQGTGLGLSLSHDCIQRHHGTLTVESIENHGTKFLISIPKNPDVKEELS